MMLTGYLSTALVFAGAFFVPNNWHPFAIPFLCWMLGCGLVLIFKEEAHDPQ